MTREEISARLEELRGGIQYLAAFDELDDEQRSAWDDATAEFEQLSERANDIAAREAAAERAAKVPTLQVNVRKSTEDVLNDRGASGRDMADAVTRSLEDRGVDADNLSHVRGILKRHQSDRAWAQNIAARSTDAYASAFMKIITGNHLALDESERAAAAVGTNTAGGFLVPTHLDPTLIITNSGTSNAIRGISRTVTLTDGNVWNGVSSAGVTASWDAELAEVSDDTPAFARVSVPIYKAQAFVQASVEAIEDAAGLQSDLLMLLSDARDRLEGAAHATGTGSAQPTGIVYALSGTSYELTTTTANLVDLTQLQTVYRTVPVRHRAASKWLMSPTFLGNIQALGTALSASYTTDLNSSYTGNLLGKPVVESDDMPSTQTTTAKDKVLVFGNFANYLIVDKPGSMSVNYIPPGFLQNTANNLPDGRVGWYAYWRSGADSINDAAFVQLIEKTSA